MMHTNMWPSEELKCMHTHTHPPRRGKVPNKHITQSITFSKPTQKPTPLKWTTEKILVIVDNYYPLMIITPTENMAFTFHSKIGIIVIWKWNWILGNRVRNIQCSTHIQWTSLTRRIRLNEIFFFFPMIK